MTQALGDNSLKGSHHEWMSLSQLQAPRTQTPSQEKEMKEQRGRILELIGFDLEWTELNSEGTELDRSDWTDGFAKFSYRGAKVLFRVPEDVPVKSVSAVHIAEQLV